MLLAGFVCLGIWLYLVLLRGGFWRIREPHWPSTLSRTPSIVAVIPARDEADVIGESVRSLLHQDYAGTLRIIVVNDDSTDNTVGEVLRASSAAAELVEIVDAGPLPSGWTGKTWALSQGVERALRHKPEYLLLTDADILHGGGNLTGLVARAQTGGLDLASLMVRLHCESLAEAALMPAFLFFFLKLYPPVWTADLEATTAGAAGGCMLLRAAALQRIGGLQQIRGELIDDCALAREVKAGGPIWMGVTSRARSLRRYRTFPQVEAMIARSAYTELRYSPALLVLTLLGLFVTYCLPVVLLFAGGVPALLGGLALLLMTIAYFPSVLFFGKSPFWALTLPLAAVFYGAATVDSAWRHWRGRGALWKGRTSPAPKKQSHELGD